MAMASSSSAAPKLSTNGRVRLTLLLRALCLSSLLLAARGFVPVGGRGRAAQPTTPGRFRPTTPAAGGPLRLVTERDVLDAVDRAERAWADALVAREKAKALSDSAEEATAAAAADSAETTNAPAMTSMGDISRVADVLQSALDAGDVLAEARGASDEADRLEAAAEKALRDSEEALERHLEDFPDSPLHDG